MKELSGLRIAAYARYSSDLQSDSSIGDQFRLLQRFLDQQGVPWGSVTRFEDAATSAASLNRLGFQKLKARLTKSPPDFDVLIVDKVDRLSRNMADSARFLQELEFAGVRLLGISDGIDTATPGARLSFGFRAVMNDQYLVDLGQNTLRGLHGRALNGFATGAVPFGYRTQKHLDVNGKSQGSTIHIHDGEADLVRRIFKLWIDGHAVIAIAGLLNAEGIPSPRRKRVRDRGWPDTTVRAILRNPAYIGDWVYGEHRWTKHPVTGNRQRRKASPEDVQRLSRPELRIIAQATWRAAQQRIVEVGGKQDKRPNKAPIRKTSYPLSGLLYCHHCGAPMVIAGGTNRRVYKCGTYHKRRNCPVKEQLREELVSDSVIDHLGKRLRSPQAIAFLADQLKKRALVSEGEAEHQHNATKKALFATQTRIGHLVDNLTSGKLSDLALGPINQALEKEEASRLALEARLASLESQKEATKSIPSKKELTLRAQGILGNLKAQLKKDPVKAREQIRAFLVDGTITMEPKEDGSWSAHFKYFPTLLLETQNGNSPRRKSEAVYSSSCAGWI